MAAVRWTAYENRLSALPGTPGLRADAEHVHYVVMTKLRDGEIVTVDRVDVSTVLPRLEYEGCSRSPGVLRLPDDCPFD